MYNHRTKGNTKKPYPSDFFDCSSYTLALQKRTHACSNHHISTKSLRALILETIRIASTQAIADEAAFIRKVREASDIRQAEAAKDIRRQLNKNRRRCGDLDGIIKKLYESYAVGRISEERFETLLTDYEQEQETLKHTIAEAEAGLSAFERDSANAEQFLALAKKYTDFQELTAPMINEFIEKIIVHAPDRSDGDRVQEVDIYLKFIGKFELPIPELTEEELREQERLRKERIRSRERYRRLKAGENLSPPFERICQNCGKNFSALRPNAKYCCPACRQKDYRRMAKGTK